MQRYEGFQHWYDRVDSAEFTEGEVDAATRAQWLDALYQSQVLFSGLLDADGTLLEANRLAIEGCGLVRRETIGRPFWECGWWNRDPELAAKMRGWCEEAVATGRSLRAVCRYFRGDGIIGMVEFGLDPIVSRDGERRVTYLVPTGLDISDLLSAQAAREDHITAEAAASRQLEERFRHALDAMIDHVTIARAVRDDNGEIVDFEIEYVNEREREDPRRERAGTLGGRLLENDPGWYRAGMYRELVAVTETGVPFTGERVPYVDNDSRGSPLTHWDVRVARLGDGFIAAWRDVTSVVRNETAALAARAAAERERTATEVLQRAALPSEIPLVDGVELGVCYQPANRDIPIGGDWYDVVPLGGDRTLLVIADVAGHGPDAAGYMVQLRNVLRTIAVETNDVGELLGRANRVANALDSDASWLTTCCVAILDRTQHHVRWALAGHPPPLLQSRDGSTRFLASPPGLPLAVANGVCYTTAAQHLEPGDRIVLFTDGLIERKGASLGDGMEQLENAMSTCRSFAPQQAADWLARNVAPGHDDVALITVDITPAW